MAYAENQTTLKQFLVFPMIEQDKKFTSKCILW